MTLTAPGALTDATSGTMTNVSATNVTLDPVASPGTTIGTELDPFTIVSSQAGPGVVIANTTGDIHLNQTSGDMTIGGITSSAGNVYLGANAGSIFDGGAAGVSVISASNGVLTASKGIGKSSGLLVTTLSELESTVGSGGLFLSNSRGLSIEGSTGTGVVASGPIDIESAGTMLVFEQISTTSGSITLAPKNNPARGEDFTLEPAVAISTQGGAVTIDAAGNVTLSSGSSISTNPTSGPAAGSITILGDTQTPGTGGSTVTVSGTLLSPTTQITTGTEKDTVLFTELPFSSIVSVDTGGGAGDSLTIDGTAANNSWTITSSSVNVITPSGSATINYKNVDDLFIDAKAPTDAGNDTFVVNGTDATTLTTINAGNGSNSLTVNASASGGSAVQNTPLLYVGGTGQNPVIVNGASGIADDFVLANEPIRVHGADVVGSGLILRYENATSLALNAVGTASYTAVYGTLVPTTITAAQSNNVELGDDTVQTAPTVLDANGKAILPLGTLADFTKPISIADPTNSTTLTVTNTNDTDDPTRTLLRRASPT